MLKIWKALEDLIEEGVGFTFIFLNLDKVQMKRVND